jgi:hypothetical protein
MAFQISPGISVSEVNLTQAIPAILTTSGAYAGPFAWGPVNKIITISSEPTLVNIFGAPDNNTATSFFSAASFLAYGNNLQVVRSANSATYNASSNANNNIVQVKNEDVFFASYLNQNNANTYGPFMARYPGALGNSLTVSMVDANTYSNTWNVNGVSMSTLFPIAPSTSATVSAAGGANDQIHLVVVDSGGLFTGTKNTVLETYSFVSKASDALDVLGNSNYYKNKVFNNSAYIYAIDPPSYATTNSTWGLPSANTSFATLPSVATSALIGGTYATNTDADTTSAWTIFNNADTVNLSLVITGAGSTTVQQYVIDNITSYRKDCVAFISPPSSAVVNNTGNEVSSITTWYNSLARTTSYAFADCGWKYMFDKYNNVYRYVPLNADIAGLCVNTDTTRDPWFSPAGYNRGALKNVVKLAWNPTQTQRDSLYPLGINPVVSFQGSGVILYGDKTLLNQPSAFDRLPVRRLFIVLEKTIAAAAKYSLFEFNDQFTQAQFVALITPFLRDIQGRRGIYNFQVVCDSTNNTPAVVNANQFVGSIYVQPARSINFIQLNFVAVGTGVSFAEVVGAV